MDVGIFSRTYEVRNLSETYRRMKDQGITHTQFNLSNAGCATLPETISDKKMEEIRNVSKEQGIFLDAVTGTFNMIDPDEHARRNGTVQFETQCRIAQALEIPIVTLCTGSKSLKSKWTWSDENLSDSSWTDLLKTTETILKYAEETDVILGVETEASNVVNTPARARKYLDTFQSPHLKIVMDGANLFRPEQVGQMRKVLDEAFDLLSKDIVLAHAKDFSFDGNLKFVAVGQGILDFPYYTELLKKSGYAGPLIMHGLSEAQVPGSLSFLKTILE